MIALFNIPIAPLLNGDKASMKQVLQHLRTGATEIAEVPAPRLSAGHVLIRTTRSLVSAGTERMLMDFGKGSLIEKARRAAGQSPHGP